jgi:quinolinate synthase
MAESIEERIATLKAERNAVILVHNYQVGEVQEIADYLGDSLDLSRRAAETDADVIVFCGVHFMAETASILSPDKVVLLPDVDAGCPMADMIEPEGVRHLKDEYPDAPVVTYVNSSAEVKAESDICCTSANAERIVRSLEAERIIFIPDRNLGRYVAHSTGREMLLSDGYCPIHVAILARDIERAKKSHPDAEVVVHPECTMDVIELSDQALSTSGMIRYAGQTKARELIIGTETGIIYRLKKENPDKEFIPASSQAVCRDMKKITLEKVLRSLEEMRPEVKVQEPVRSKANEAIVKMLSVS